MRAALPAGPALHVVPGKQNGLTKGGKTMTTQPTTAALAPLPDEIEKEDALAEQARSQSIAQLALQDPLAVKRYLEKLEEGLAILRQVAIKSTTPYDWTRFKDKEGNVICILRDQGAANIRKWLGISIFAHRGDPLDAKVPGPKVSVEKQDGGGTVTVVEMWADAFCARTGERIEGVYSAVRSDQKFRGRETLQDDKASVRTYLDSKVTRILSGLRKVPESVLVEAGIDTKKSYAGSGYGSSAERQAGALTSDEVKTSAAKLRDEILRRVGGDSSAAKQLCRDITKGDKADSSGKVFPGWDTVERLTKDWQVENAWKKLKVHSTFGDQHVPPAGDREPGSEG
jgi:hypothetical protein